MMRGLDGGVADERGRTEGVSAITGVRKGLVPIWTVHYHRHQPGLEGIGIMDGNDSLKMTQLYRRKKVFVSVLWFSK